jgi:hypothetical protein
MSGTVQGTILRTASMALATAFVASGALGGAAATRPDRSVEDAAKAATAASSADDSVNFVVAISVDGLNPDAIRQLGRSGASAFYRLIDNGATTLNARTAYERTTTVPNHTGMVTGRWITKGGGHGVTFNDDNGYTVHRSAAEYVHSMFDVVHNRGGSTAFYSAKDKFAFLDRSWDSRHARRDPVGRDNGRDKIDRYYFNDEASNVSRLIKRLHAAPDELSLVHLAYPDRAGHAYGFMSPRYMSAVHQTDVQIGRILDAIRNDARLRRHANVVLTADHGGGRGTNHTDPKDPANYTIPFMAWGIGVAKGRNLYALNADDRRRPGSARTRYAGTQPIRNAEMANLVTDLLDMPRVLNSTFNVRQDLTVG